MFDRDKGVEETVGAEQRRVGRKCKCRRRGRRDIT